MPIRIDPRLVVDSSVCGLQDTRAYKIAFS